MIPQREVALPRSISEPAHLEDRSPPEFEEISDFYRLNEAIDPKTGSPSLEIENPSIPPSRDDSIISSLDYDELIPDSTNNTNTTGGWFGKSSRECPWYKKLPKTGFTIDAFSYGVIEDCTAYFLSHFHADHYGGLTAKFSAGPIYCSQVTANLVKSQLRVDPKYIIVLPMETVVLVQGVKVTLIDANHCPGAVIFLFETNDSQKHLHTGDFRALHPFHTHHPFLLNTRLCSIYLDTTYLDSRYSFPNQATVLQVLSDLMVEIVRNGRKLEEVLGSRSTEKSMMRQFLSMGSGSGSNLGVGSLVEGAQKIFGAPIAKRGVLVCVGTYTIGKERVFKSLAKALNSKIYADTQKQKILKCLDDPELNNLLTSNPLDAIVHVVKIGQLKKEVSAS
ncbi:UNVERIFIED_CONTAM: hypothetical protein HDU68_010023 [Siphonaria sp. JEL0065]|nr:hypothetical protein HDU68_010023 [Siphonaria sp. JEL0065]